jgi:hypothetical protein
MKVANLPVVAINRKSAIANWQCADPCAIREVVVSFSLRGGTQAERLRC